LILDDGFQHRRLARDLDIVLIDCLNPWGYGYLLPRGLLREPLAALQRADLILLTRADLCPAGEKRRIRQRVAAIRGRDECVEVEFRPTGLVNAEGETVPLEVLGGRSVAAFCGIGNPDGFRRTLQQQGCSLGTDGLRVFPDHHHYTTDDLDRLGRAAEAGCAGALVTTLKDLVKINQTDLRGVSLWAVTLGTEVTVGAELLARSLEPIGSHCAGAAEAAIARDNNPVHAASDSSSLE
ncbi:MAG TPA: tetraacyldisaccharide 4'-kinase, partial [Planctomycetaceae bacterium]|nr:tetraacyldisaccharide 4'-kinase [Planctomycetaceae bacterium]